MSAAPPPHNRSAAEQAAAVQAAQLAHDLQAYRLQAGGCIATRSGMCMADAWALGVESIDADFALDASLVRRILSQPDAGAAGPQWRAAPPPRPPFRPGVPAGRSALDNYLFPAPSSHALGTAGRLADETAGSVYGPGNILANSSAALAGALQGAGERQAGTALRDGLDAVLGGRAQSVPVGRGIEIYNAASARQQPRPRLRVSGTVQTIRAAIPAVGSAAGAWRPNGPGTAATLRGRTMTAQQMRQASIMAGERGLPAPLRWATGRVGGGILTFAPSAALDAYNAVGTDLSTGRTTFNTRQFMVDSGRSQSGNVVGLVASVTVVAVAGAAIAGAPLVLVALGAGILAQALWNWSGASDRTARLVDNALR